MQRKQIGRHLKRLAKAGVVAGPVVVNWLEGRHPKYGPLGRQALEVVEALTEGFEGNAASSPTDGADHPSPPLTRYGYVPGEQFDPAIQEDALGGILREVQDREQRLRAEAIAGGTSRISH